MTPFRLYLCGTLACALVLLIYTPWAAVAVASLAALLGLQTYLEHRELTEGEQIRSQVKAIEDKVQQLSFRSLGG